jgi:hypothetical protein
MPRPSAVHAATAVYFVARALALTGVIVLVQHSKGLGLGLIGAGFVFVFVSSWISTLGRGRACGGAAHGGQDRKSV